MLTETMIRPQLPTTVAATGTTRTDPTRQVLDSIVKLKEVFTDENLSMALSKLSMPNGINGNPALHDDSFGIADQPMTGATKLKYMLEHTKELIVCPGVYDGLSARAAMEVGFDALYMTGAGTTASRLGMADLAIAQLHDMKEHAEMIANLDPAGPPLIADMDTGYGGKSTISPFPLPFDSLHALCTNTTMNSQTSTSTSPQIEDVKAVQTS